MAAEAAEKTISVLLEAFRRREMPAAGLSCSQVMATCSQTNSWVDDCKEQVPDLEEVSLTSLLEAASACDVLDLLKALQAICRSEGVQKEGSKWFQLAKSCIANPELVEGRKGKEIINFVINQVDQLEGQACVDLVEALLDSIGPNSNENHEKCLDLLPKLLAKAVKMDKISVRRGQLQDGPSRTSEFAGEDYRAAVIEELCRLEWPKSLVVPICTVLRDLHISEEQLKGAISRIAKETRSMELQGLPPLVYQLLLLSTHGHRTQILRIILSVFTELDERCSIQLGDNARMSQDDITESAVEENELVQVEGIVMLHFTFAVKQDMTLGQELLRVLKLRVCDLAPFEAALLLSLSRVPRYESKAMDILRKAAEQDFAHQCKVTSSAWISGLTEMRRPSSIEQVMRVVLRRSSRGWDHVVPGLVSFTFHLLETQARKCAGAEWSGGAGGQQAAAASFGKLVAGTAVKCSLGLILHTFRQHEAVREDVLAQIFAHVLTRDEAVPCFISLLSRIASRCSRDVMAFLPKVKEALEYIGYMAPAAAVALVRALDPILRLQPSLHDYLMIILRKSLFSREPESRLVALDCLLHLATLAPRPSSASSHSASQYSASQAPEAGAVEDVGLEVVGQLRRCLAQGAAMRQRLYSGLADVVRAKPALLEYVSNTLLLHLKRYCQDNPEGRVLMLDKCLDESKNIAEPIAHLLHAVTQCVMVHAAAEESAQAAMVDAESDVMAAARAQMNKLLNWIASSELEDFDLERETVFSVDTDAGRKAWNSAKLLLGVYEALLEYELLCGAVSEQSFEARTLRLLEKMQELASLLAAKGPKPKKGGVPPALAEDKSTLLSFRFSERVLAARSGGSAQSCWAGQVEDAMWRSEEFVPAVLQVVGRQLAHARAADLAPERRKQVFQSCCLRIAPLLVRQFFAQLTARKYMPAPAGVPSKKASAGREEPVLVAVVVLQALGSCVQLACARFAKEQVAAMARELRRELRAAEAQGSEHAEEEEPRGGDADAEISACIGALQVLFRMLLQEEDDSSMSARVMDMMTALGAALDCTALHHHVEWTKQVCVESGAEVDNNSSLAKAVVASYLEMTVGSRELEEALALAKDVLALTLALPEEEEEVQEPPPAANPTYGIVNDDTVNVVIVCLVDQVKRCCDEVEWVLGYLDARARPDVHDNDEESDLPEHIASARASHAVEDLALSRLTRLVSVMLALAGCVRVQLSSSEVVIGGFARLYRAAEYTARRLLTHKAMIRRPFQQLMKLIGVDLNEAMYDLLMRYANAETKDSTKQKICKEQKLLPALIYHVERLEANLIKIQKDPANKSKVDFMKNFKRSQSRDFKIHKNVVQETLSKGEDDKENKDKGKGKKKRGKGKGKKGGGDGDGEEGEDLSQALSELGSQRSAKRARPSQH